jgi:hypothetical protein
MRPQHPRLRPIPPHNPTHRRQVRGMSKDSFNHTSRLARHAETTRRNSYTSPSNAGKSAVTSLGNVHQPSFSTPEASAPLVQASRLQLPDDATTPRRPLPETPPRTAQGQWRQNAQHGQEHCPRFIRSRMHAVISFRGVSRSYHPRLRGQAWHTRNRCQVSPENHPGCRTRYPYARGRVCVSGGVGGGAPLPWCACQLVRPARVNGYPPS